MNRRRNDGLVAAQTNNALIIESTKVAATYSAYWDQLEKDTGTGNQDGTWQNTDFRQGNRERNQAMIKNPITLEDGSGLIEVMFSPNTKVKSLPKKPTEVPVDMARVFELMSKAKQAILFLAFDPGNHSILDAAGEALKNNPNLFVRGALTSPVRALNFKEALSGTAEDGTPGVAVIGNKATADETKAEPDYRAIPAGAVNKTDAFGAWEAEIHSAGHAIIHDKIVVIDPFSKDCVVITGSHNQGYGPPITMTKTLSS